MGPSYRPWNARFREVEAGRVKEEEIQNKWLLT